MYQAWSNMFGVISPICPLMGLSKGSKKQLSESDLQKIKEIAKKLKALRKERGYTSYENFAFDTGIPRMMVYRLEKGDQDFNFTSLLKMLNALDTTLEEFFSG